MNGQDHSAPSWDGKERRNGDERRQHERRSGVDRRDHVPWHYPDDEPARELRHSDEGGSGGPSHPPPSWALNSWGALQSLIMIIVMLLGGIAWGLKLEARIDRVEERWGDVDQQVSRGILPRTEERIKVVEESLERLIRAQETTNDMVQRLSLVVGIMDNMNTRGKRDSSGFRKPAE